MIPTGSDDRGNGPATPLMTRAERERELTSLLQRAGGAQVIESFFARYTGLLAADCPPASLLMVQSVLNREYPCG